jgi:predicted phage baseplate assembly protein
VHEDASIAFTREGDIHVEGPAADIVATQEGRVPEAMYWLRVRLAEGRYPAGRAPTIDFIRANVVEAENLSTIRDEFVGISRGLPHQVFTLQHQPVWVPTETTVRADGASGALALWIQETGQPAEPWLLKPDLLASGPEDPHYVLNASTGEIRFGDGKNGRIPTAGAEIVARLYRYGGGKAGNVGAGLINAPLTVLTGVEKVTNDRPAVGGRDEQNIEEFKQRAPVRLRHRNRAVSIKDFAELTMEVGGIAKATAIPLMHPDHLGVEVPGAITIVVVPDSEDVPPQPSQAQLEQVCRYLEPRRLLTTELYVKGPEYQKIRVMAHVSAQPYAAFDDVARRVKDELNAFLDPLGRAGSESSGADFGLELFPTSLYAVILSVADVKRVLYLELTVNDQRHDLLTEAVKVPRDGLLYGALDHDIIVERFQDMN